MRGIILAGGTGSRLHPITLGHQQAADPGLRQADDLLPAVHADAGGHPGHPGDHHAARRRAFQRLLGDGSQFGINLTYAAAGPARRARAGVHHRRGLHRQRPVRPGAGRQHLLRQRARAPSCSSFDDIDGARDLRLPGRRTRRRTASWSSTTRAGRFAGGEAGATRRATTRCPGLYFYDNDVVGDRHATSSRRRAASYEITDVNRVYLEQGQLRVEVLPRGTAWLDTGTFDSLNDAVELRPHDRGPAGTEDRCPEEVAWRQGFLTDDELRERAEPLVKSGYGAYLLGLLEP